MYELILPEMLFGPFVYVTGKVAPQLGKGQRVISNSSPGETCPSALDLQR